jgi:4-hydroxy-tetrahydrodipicolinate reductase
VIRLAVLGAAGRMGQRLTARAVTDDRFQLVAAIDAPGSPRIGQPAMGSDVVSTDDCKAAFDVLVDFSLPAGTMRGLQWCLRQKRPLVSGTTGLSGEQTAALREAARSIPVLHATNMSVGANLLLRLAEQTAAALGTAYDVEIVETHHRHKRDAPSGTAKTLLETICRVREQSPAETAQFGRSGIGPERPRGQIGVHSLRLGEIIGCHEAHFADAYESVTIRHEARDRDVFAVGALRAAAWIVSQPPGLYAMRDVL